MYSDPVFGSCNGGSQNNPSGYTVQTPAGIDIIKPINRLSRVVVTSNASNSFRYIIDKLKEQCNKDVLNEVICGTTCSDGNLGDVIGAIMSHFTWFDSGRVLELSFIEGASGSNKDGDFVQEGLASGSIMLNTNGLFFAGQEYRAATIIHEMIHAYFDIVGWSCLAGRWLRDSFGIILVIRFLKLQGADIAQRRVSPTAVVI